MRFEEYVGSQQPALLRFSTVLTGDGSLAEDIVQTVLGRAYQQWARVAAADSPHAYVRRMIVNEYLSWRRKWHRVIPAADLATLTAQVPDHAEAHWIQQGIEPVTWLIDLNSNTVKISLVHYTKAYRDALIARYGRGWVSVDQEGG